MNTKKKGVVIMKKYIKIFKISLKNNMTYFKDFLLSNIFIILIIFIFVHLWKNIYIHNVKSNFTYNKTIWYLIINESVFFNNMDLFKKIEDDIKTGNICYYLNKPYSYPIYITFETLGKILINFITSLTFGCIVGLLLVGKLSSFELIYAIPMIIMMFFGILLNLLIYILISLTSFWLEENRAFIWIYRQLVFTFGGFLIPITFFPKALYKLTYYMPWTYISYHTSNSCINFNFNNFIHTILGQLTYIVIISLFIMFLFKKGAEVLNVNGG